MRYLGLKTKKDRMKRCWPESDTPSIKKSEAVYLLQGLEIITYKSEKELKGAFEECVGKRIKEHLWGWTKRDSDDVSWRIHVRSVRSHGGKDSFYHTLGHELAHILEVMEQIAPSKNYLLARWIDVWYTIKVTYYVLKGTIKCYIERVGRKSS